jgi:glycosyltransferase involved in cell wall biosynthesis
MRRGLPFIFEVGDLWPDAPIQLGFIKNYFFKSALYSLERTIYRQAQSVVALSPMIRDAIDKKVPGKRIDLIPNMSDTAFYKPEVKDAALQQKFGVADKFVISYIGAVGFANGLDYYLECARACQKAGASVQFLLCGDGAMRAHIKAMAQKLGLNNLTFIDFQNRDGVREVMNVTDAVFICYRPAPILQTGSPNKYFDGLAAGKLIIVNFGGWIKEEIEAHTCGVYTDSRNPAGIVKLLEPFMSDRALLLEYGKRSRKLAETRYSRELLGDAFAAIFRTR